MNFLNKMLASISLMLKQPLTSFCDIETTHGGALVTKQGDYATVIRINGMRRMAGRADIARIGQSLRIDLSGALESPGHAIVGWFASDPELSGVEIDRLCLNACRSVANALDLDLTDILQERARLWPKAMRWEASYFVVWTRKSVLTREEKKLVKEEQDALAKEIPLVGGSQRFYIRSDVMDARHKSFVSRVMTSLKHNGIAAEEIGAHAALKLCREVIYRETAGSAWKASLLGDSPMPRLPEEGTEPKPEHLLWPSIASQIFNIDAMTHGGQEVEIGEYGYAPVDMDLGPEEPRPFAELAATLGRDRLPWRTSIIIEGGGRNAMTMKDIGAGFLAMFPANNDLRRAFATLRHEREQNNHIAVRLRASFATWADRDERRKLRRQASTLTQRIESWGGCKATSVVGDPLEAAMSSVPALALASTANPSLALLGDALAMLPWSRTAGPWQSGSVLFSAPDGSIQPYDPATGQIRPFVCDIFVAPPGSGKSVLANTINIGLCLSSASIGSGGARLPLIGKVDIGPSAEGFLRLMQEALGPARRYEAIFVTMQFARGYEFNIFDLQVGCEYPLPLERAFLQNFLTLATISPTTKMPFEGVPQMIGLVIDEAYRLCTSVPGGSPKPYRAGLEPEVDEMLADRRVTMLDDMSWREVVDALIGLKAFRLAEIAQRHAVPIMQDLINAARSDQVRDAFKQLKIQATHESACELFERYIYDFIRRFPTLNHTTKLDFGPARIIVIDIAAVAPKGSSDADWQTEMMYMLSRQIIARNFFLHPDYAKFVPEAVRPYHRKRFQEIQECIKRLDYDEWHRSSKSPLVRAQAELDVREGRKHNVQLGFSSQLLEDIGEGILAQATGRFILKAANADEAESIIAMFKLSQAGADIVRYRLKGPGPGGAPFLAIFDADGDEYEQMLVNTLGPVELWALSTTPKDTAVRNRLYQRVGFSEALRRLSKIFPNGSATKEIDRRTKERLDNGETTALAQGGVYDELVDELANGTGIGLRLRDLQSA